MNYYEKNKKHNNEISKLYRKNNLPFVKRQQRIWYIKTKKYIICSCGSRYLKHNEKNHFKTNKHNTIKSVKSKNIIIEEVEEIKQNNNPPEIKKYIHKNPLIKGFTISWS